jgi:hypothetical protein
VGCVVDIAPSMNASGFACMAPLLISHINLKIGDEKAVNMYLESKLMKLLVYSCESNSREMVVEYESYLWMEVAFEEPLN